MRKRWVAADAGVALVEFALIAPVLLLLIIGILDVARGVNAYVTIANAAREGSHYAALHPTAMPASIQDAVRARVVPLDPNKVAVTAFYHDGASFEAWPSGGIPAGASTDYVPVQVRVSYPWQAVTTLIGAFFPSTPLSASSTTDTLR